MATETDSGATRRGLRRPGLASRRIPLRLNDAELAARHGEDRKFVWSLARAFELLHAFRPGQGPLGNAELSARTGLPKATVTHGIQTPSGSSGFLPSPDQLLTRQPRWSWVLPESRSQRSTNSQSGP